MKYEKSLTEVFKWKEEAEDELFNMTVQERFKLLRESERRRKSNQLGVARSNVNMISNQLRSINNNNIHHETDTGISVGNEAW